MAPPQQKQVGVHIIIGEQGGLVNARAALRVHIGALPAWPEPPGVDIPQKSATYSRNVQGSDRRLATLFPYRPVQPRQGVLAAGQALLGQVGVDDVPEASRQGSGLSPTPRRSRYSCPSGKRGASRCARANASVVLPTPPRPRAPTMVAPPSKPASSASQYVREETGHPGLKPPPLSWHLANHPGRIPSVRQNPWRGLRHGRATPGSDPQQRREPEPTRQGRRPRLRPPVAIHARPTQSDPGGGGPDLPRPAPRGLDRPHRHARRRLPCRKCRKNSWGDPGGRPP
jgi:hypothetical protein